MINMNNGQQPWAQTLNIGWISFLMVGKVYLDYENIEIIYTTQKNAKIMSSKKYVMTLCIQYRIVFIQDFLVYELRL